MKPLHLPSQCGSAFLQVWSFACWLKAHESAFVSRSTSGILPLAEAGVPPVHSVRTQETWHLFRLQKQHEHILSIARLSRYVARLCNNLPAYESLLSHYRIWRTDQQSPLNHGDRVQSLPWLFSCSYQTFYVGVTETEQLPLGQIPLFIKASLTSTRKEFNTARFIINEWPGITTWPSNFFNDI